MDGIEVLSSLRAQGIQTPVLVLTALGSVENRVRGLQSGADDYLVKPFAFPELTARLEALSRRSGLRPSLTQTIGPLSLDITTRRAPRGGPGHRAFADRVHRARIPDAVQGTGRDAEDAERTCVGR